ncbi:hypothetical protein TNCV_203511 [Trichonephila clavipes]|nr:hypothetical protein TNCV_203511 [Trichonephila clavipes]
MSKIIPTDINKTGSLLVELEIFVEAKVMLKANIDAKKSLVNSAIVFFTKIYWPNSRYVQIKSVFFQSEANPQVYVETPLHPEKLTVWCALWSGGIIGPYFFKSDKGHNVTVNGDR